MATIQIKLKDVYVDPLLALISSHKEIPIDDISIDSPSRPAKSGSKAKLLRIAEECAALPTVDQRFTEQILGYVGDNLGVGNGVTY